MSMMWVKKQSKWVVIAAAVVIGGSLILMDLPSNQGMAASQSVGEVDGVEIPTASFQQELQAYLRAEEASTGRPVESARGADIRAELFQSRVQAILLDRLAKNYSLRATREEMLDWLLRNPAEIAYSIAQYEGPDQVPFFLTDSGFNPSYFQAWMSQDSVYDRIGLRALEARLKTFVVPQYQLQQIFLSQVHRTDLEEAFLLETREDKTSLRYYHVSADAFSGLVPAPTEEALKAHFEASPDSFWFPQEGARMKYVRLPLVPSAADSALMLDFANELRERALSGEDFAELARSYSSDAASAPMGGRLPAAAAYEWHPAFAKAAFALSPGQVSAPVLGPNGWHLIQLHAKTREGGVEKAEVSHLLLSISAGTETIDSVLSLATDIRNRAEKSGLAEAVAGTGANVVTSPIFSKGQRSPLGIYVPGAASFAFSPLERKAKISEPLQSDEAIYVLERDAMFPAGRDFARAREAVERDYKRAEALKAARAEAERVRPEIVAAANPPAKVGQAVLMTSGPAAAESYVAGFGFGEPALYQASRQKQGEWGPVLSTPYGAVIAQVVESQPLSASEKAERIRSARRESDGFQASMLYQRWAADLPRSAKVKNRLDEIYRE